MKLYTGTLPRDHVARADELHLLLTVHDNGVHELATRPNPWATWSPPVTLTPETPGHTLQVIPDLVHAGDCLETRCLTCGCCAHCVEDGHCTGCADVDCVCAS